MSTNRFKSVSSSEGLHPSRVASIQKQITDLLDQGWQIQHVTSTVGGDGKVSHHYHMVLPQRSTPNV